MVREMMEEMVVAGGCDDVGDEVGGDGCCRWRR